MKEQLLRLAGRIQDEFIELVRVVDRVQEGLQRAQRSADDFYLDSVALNLHSFYAGLERLFEVANIRPAVISEESRDSLDEYRGFRHIVRNVYTFVIS